MNSAFPLECTLRKRKHPVIERYSTELFCQHHHSQLSILELTFLKRVNAVICVQLMIPLFLLYRFAQNGVLVHIIRFSIPFWSHNFAKCRHNKNTKIQNGFNSVRLINVVMVTQTCVQTTTCGGYTVAVVCNISSAILGHGLKCIVMCWPQNADLG